MYDPKTWHISKWRFTSEINQCVARSLTFRWHKGSWQIRSLKGGIIRHWSDTITYKIIARLDYWHRRGSLSNEWVDLRVVRQDCENGRRWC